MQSNSKLVIGPRKSNESTFNTQLGKCYCSEIPQAGVFAVVDMHIFMAILPFKDISSHSNYSEPTLA